jgi:hypothetical protein
MSRPAHIVGASRPSTAIAASIPTIQQQVLAGNTIDAMEIDQQETAAITARPPLIARLSKCPRNLHELWREYEHGIGGYKAAKLFTASERGKEKCKYCRRNNFWKIVAEMVRAGDSADTAIEKIYRVYGQSSTVTQVLNCIRQDNKRGGHPDLKVCHL